MYKKQQYCLGLFLIIVFLLFLWNDDGNKLINTKETFEIDSLNANIKGIRSHNESLHIKCVDGKYVYVSGTGTVNAADLRKLIDHEGLTKDSIFGIIFGDEITILEKECIDGWTNLRSVKFGNGIECIEKNNAINCPNLEYIYIPGTCQDIGKDFAGNCASPYYIITDNDCNIRENFNNYIIIDGIRDISDIEEAKRKGLFYASMYDAAQLYSSDPTYDGVGNIKAGYSYNQYGPGKTFQEGEYIVTVEGKNFEEVTDNDIWLVSWQAQDGYSRSEAEITSTSIRYTALITNSSNPMDFCVNNRSNRIIEVEYIKVAEKNKQLDEGIKYWFYKESDF